MAFTAWAAGCGGHPPATSTPAPAATSAVQTAPTPFTADQIKASIHTGRRYIWNVELADHRHEVHSLAFVAVDADGAVIATSALDASGQQLAPPERNHTTWAEARDHASFPADATTITDETITVPAGRYPCRLYTVTQGPKVMQFYFATTMPGPPVKIVATSAGQVIETRELASVIDDESR